MPQDERILPIVQAGELVLRQRARPLTAEEIRSEAVQQLIANMRLTMRWAPGVGLAAPQIGESLQLVVIEDPQEFLERMTADQLRDMERTVVPFHVLVNPELEIEDAREAEFFEGCLSVGDFRALVKRARGVRVRALNERAEPVEIHASGWYARILQHEIDHLHGTLCIDRMAPRSFCTLENFGRYWANLPSSEVRRQLDIP